MLSIPISKYFEIKNQEYIHLKLIPTKSIKNNKTHDILRLVNKMFISLNKLICIEDKKLVIKTQLKASYYVYITKEKINFYFIVPKIFYSKFKVKFKEVWKSVEIEELDNIPLIENGIQYQLMYKKKDFFSTNADMRNNELLNANMTIIELLQSDEEISILYNFIPTSEKQLNYFKASCQKFIKEYKESSVKYTSNKLLNIVIKILDYSIDFINSTLDFIFDIKQSERKVVFDKLSQKTLDKSNSDICKTQILITSKGDSKSRSKTITESLIGTYSEVSNDNEFVGKRLKKEIDITKPVLPYVKILNTSIYEDANFVALPGDSIIKQYKSIEHNNIYDKAIPNSLKTGDLFMAHSLKGEEVYYSTDKNFSRLGRVLIGGMGSGKTNNMTRLAESIIQKGDGLVVLDIIKDCELAENIKAVTPRNRLIEIDCSDVHQLQGFCFNELTCNSPDKYRKIAKCMEKSSQLYMLLNTINAETKLTPRMLRYFNAACTISFYKDSNSSFKDIIRVLMSPNSREDLLHGLSGNDKVLLEDEINDLMELDKIDKNGNVENYDTKIDGIIDRISILKTNLYTKLAFNKSAANNINFVKALNENKIILIKAREEDFTNRSIRDLIATFYLSKVWLAKQISSKTKTHIFIDEINLFPTAQIIFQDILTECRKFSFIPTISLHFLNQCNKKCKEAILSSGMSFILIAGADIRNFFELKELFIKEGYTESDFLNLKRFHALCLVKSDEKVYSAFVVKLPK